MALPGLEWVIMGLSDRKIKAQAITAGNAYAENINETDRRIALRTNRSLTVFLPMTTPLTQKTLLPKYLGIGTMQSISGRCASQMA